MTRTLLTPDGARWTVTPAPSSPHNPGDRRVWLTFVSDGGGRRLQHAPAGFDLAAATEAELLEVLQLDPWGLLREKSPASDRDL